MCRGESSCILPIAPAAVHTNPTGSRLAIRHFTEYLEQFPDDLEVRWLLNLAHMTLGEYPEQGRSPVPDLAGPLPSTRSSTSASSATSATSSGVNRFNQAGGAIMDDFDNDGLLDLAVTILRPHRSPWRSTATRGTAPSRTAARSAGVTGQLGGLVCYQTDYNNDGRLDIFIPRGAWFPYPIRPSLLRNNGDGTFTDVTRGGRAARPGQFQLGVAGPITTTTAGSTCSSAASASPTACITTGATAPSRRSPPRPALTQTGRPSSARGRPGSTTTTTTIPTCSSTTCSGDARLYHNNRDGTFTDVTASMGIDGPRNGFSCWAWDYDNDGWLDIFATCYDRTLADVVKGLLGQPHGRHSNRLFRNRDGKGFENKTKEAGLDLVFATMGSNFGDFDNDGFLDFYLGTGDPNLAHAGPQPHVQERRRPAVRRDHRHAPAPATSRRGTASPAATGTATATSTSSSRWAAPSTATSTTTSCSRTPARGTTG